MASAEYYRFIEKVRARPKAENASVEERRAEYERIGSRLAPPPGVAFEPVDAGGVPAEWARPESGESDAAVLYMHGGGYAIGSIGSHRALCARLALASGMPVLSIDYRLAPEHRFPAAVDDALASYRWLLARCGDPGRIVLAGDSAGGGLVLATLLAAREAGLPQPAAAVCLSPLTDMAKEGASMRTHAHLDPIVDPAGSAENAQRYLGPDGDPRHPLASPLYGDLRGLPPLLVMVGTWEVLLDDSTRLAERARAAGVDVDLQVWEEMIHVWPFFASFFPEGQQAIDLAGDFIRGRVLAIQPAAASAP